MIFTFANSKGGVGKTTSTLMTALTLARRGKDVEVWDCDPQASLTAWGDKVERAGGTLPFKISFIPQHRIKKDLATAEYTVIDTPPASSPTIQAAIDCADMVMIPIIVGTFAVDRTLETLKTAQGKHHAVLFVAAQPNVRLFQATREMLDAGGAPLCEAVIPRRARLAELLEVAEIPEEDFGYGPALDEIEAALKGIK